MVAVDMEDVPGRGSVSSPRRVSRSSHIVHKTVEYLGLCGQFRHRFGGFFHGAGRLSRDGRHLSDGLVDFFA